MKSTTSGIVMNPSGSSPPYSWPGSRHCQFGVSRRSESHRSVRHEFATSPRSSTTWSTERSDSSRLIARPVCPAPMTTVVVRTELLSVCGLSLEDLDLHVGRVGDDVVHGGALLRLRHQCADLVGRRVGVDVVRHLDVAETVADIAVDAEDAAHVHRAFD